MPTIERTIMSDEELVRLRPRDLATVWAAAFGQLVDLWRSGMMALLEAGSGEDRTIISDECNLISVRRVGGGVPRLIARNLVGQSFGRPLDGRVVTFTEKGPGGPGQMLVDCCVDESRAQQVQGDIYRGEVVDEQGTRIARVALDAGS
jgi:hypothetical protein